MANFKEDLNGINAFVFDVDGVFTNGKLYMFAQNEFVRAFNIKDGYAVKYAVQQGYIMAIISGGDSDMVRKRFIDLGITDIYLNITDKTECLEDFYFKYDIDPASILFMGDDLPDYEVMKKCGLPTCPSDAAEEIKSVARYISNFEGGNGCVRDVIEQVLRAQGKWM
ncbi:MAG: HAD-IIIA family hydrolase [Bacteroidales bacterium]|nr:HAD-IIIA family hydrolase [Bacteroidales bacterium]